MDSKKVLKEHKRIEGLLNRAEVPQQLRDVLAPVVDNLAWMRIKLDETREEMKEAGVTCEYDNGGGQTGVRENPVFKGYLNLWRGYLAGIEKLQSYLPKDLPDEVIKDDLTPLAKVIQMKKVN